MSFTDTNKKIHTILDALLLNLAYVEFVKTDQKCSILQIEYLRDKNYKILLFFKQKHLRFNLGFYSFFRFVFRVIFCKYIVGPRFQFCMTQQFESNICIQKTLVLVTLVSVFSNKDYVYILIKIKF